MHRYYDNICGCFGHFWYNQNIKSAIKYIFIWFLISRILLSLVGVCAHVLFSNIEYKNHKFNDHKVIAIDIWSSWDSLWYLDIAKLGYSNERIPEPLNPGRKNIAFFPLYPYSIKFLAPIFGNDFILTGVILSNFFLLGSCLLLYKITKIHFNDKIAKRSVKYMLIYPSSFVLSGVFTESMYLFFMLLSIYLYKTSRYKLVAFATFFASLTRITVITLVPFFMYLFEKSNNRLLKKLWWLVGLILGIVVVCFINYKVTGDPFRFVNIQQHWNRHVENPLYYILIGLNLNVVQLKFAIIWFLFELYLVTKSMFKLPFEYVLLSLGMLFLPFTSSPLSITRYMAVIFPIFIYLAIVSDDVIKERLVSWTMLVLQLFLMVTWAFGAGFVI